MNGKLIEFDERFFIYQRFDPFACCALPAAMLLFYRFEACRCGR